MDMKIFYICDRKRSCNSSRICGLECRHTMKEDHAVNGTMGDKLDLERFEKKKMMGGVVTFWERIEE